MRKLCILLLASSLCITAWADDPAPLGQIQPVLNAIGANQVQSRIEKLVSFGTRHTFSDTESEHRGIGAARRWILQEMEGCAASSQGRMTVALDTYVQAPGPRAPRAVEVVNVVATLKGTAVPERVLVVSGHYDSRASDVMDASVDAPGADDDASGSAAVMAMACAFAPYRWPATLVFMNVAGEEQGLFGADHWAEVASRDKRNIIGMVTNDIIGSPVGDQGQRDDQQVRLFADGFSPLLKLFLDAQKAPPTGTTPTPEATRRTLEIIARTGGSEDTPTSEWGRYLKESAEHYLPGFQVKLISRRDRFLRGGDHLPFLERGYAAVRFTEPFENFAHQHQDVRSQDGQQFGDLPRFVDYAYVARVAQANAAGLASLALAPAAPEQVGMTVSELTNDTRLVWKASTAADVVGYRIYWREAGAPVWQHSVDIDRLSAYTLKDISKDNFVFGVAARNATGQTSLPVFPQPAR